MKSKYNKSIYKDIQIVNQQYHLFLLEGKIFDVKMQNNILLNDI